MGLTAMKSALGAMGLNTLCSWEKCSPPMFQLIRTAPLISSSRNSLTNCVVNFYNNKTQHIIRVDCHFETMTL